MDKDNEMLIDGIDERIESFLRGTMNAEEEAIFKRELKSNPELRNRAMTMAYLIKGIHTNEEDREKKVILSVEKSYKSKVRSLVWWACSVAAVFAIFFGINKDRRYSKLNTIISPYYTEYSMADISRGEIDTVAVAHLYALFSQIQKKRNVSATIKELESIQVSLDEDFTYYPFANDIAWNLALAYIKEDNIEKAIPILQKFKDDNSDMPIGNKAALLLKAIEDL